MRYVENPNTDPALNMALEEYLMTAPKFAAMEEPLVMLYFSAPSILVGRHQNTFEEVNLDYVEAHHLPVVRRRSGGGAIYEDLGTLIFAFITPYRRDNVRNFRRFTAPVVATLQALGLPAELSGRNDILIEGRKVSGSAQYTDGKRMVTHGTLLFDTDLEALTQALRVKTDKIASKGLKSIRSRVTNIREHLPRDMSVEEFRQALLHGIFPQEPIPALTLTAEDWAGAEAIAARRYRTWAWNFGHSPKFNVQLRERLPLGEIDVRLEVRKGIITEAKIYGDFFGEAELSELEAKLRGTPYRREALAAALEGVELRRYFGEITLERFLDLLTP